MTTLYRYSRWDGTQQLFPFDADELLEALSDELINDGDLARALQRMMRNGDQGKMDGRMPGLQQLMERLKQQRERELSRHNLNSGPLGLQSRDADEPGGYGQMGKAGNCQGLRASSLSLRSI